MQSVIPSFSIHIYILCVSDKATRRQPKTKLSVTTWFTSQQYFVSVPMNNINIYLRKPQNVKTQDVQRREEDTSGNRLDLLFKTSLNTRQQIWLLIRSVASSSSSYITCMCVCASLLWPLATGCIVIGLRHHRKCDRILLLYLLFWSQCTICTFMVKEEAKRLDAHRFINSAHYKLVTAIFGSLTTAFTRFFLAVINVCVMVPMTGTWINQNKMRKCDDNLS